MWITFGALVFRTSGKPFMGHTKMAPIGAILQ